MSPRLSSSALLAALWAACAPPLHPVADEGVGTVELFDPSLDVRAFAGDDRAFDVATWNLEWFGNRGLGPSDERLQATRAAAIVDELGFDLWALQEITTRGALDGLVDRLDGYDSVHVLDAAVDDGDRYFHSGEQGLALVFDEATVELVEARVVLGHEQSQFAGRPPLEATLDVTVGGVTQEVVVLVVHLKASSDRASWAKRQAASRALEGYLDRAHPDARVLVAGDFNDDIDRAGRRPSPFDNFVSAADWSFVSEPLTDAGLRTTIRGRQTLDHLLASDELAADLIDGSVQRVPAPSMVPDFERTTSDHYPVAAAFRWPLPEPEWLDDGADTGDSGDADLGYDLATARVVLNEVLANEPGGDTDGEFIEVRHLGDDLVDLDGWSLRDSSGERHVFEANLVLVPGEVAVVYGRDATSGALGLANRGDTVELVDPEGAVRDRLVYTARLAGADGVSMVREREGDPEAPFVRHDAVSELPRSPGRATDGAAY